MSLQRVLCPAASYIEMNLPAAGPAAATKPYRRQRRTTLEVSSISTSYTPWFGLVLSAWIDTDESDCCNAVSRCLSGFQC